MTATERIPKEYLDSLRARIALSDLISKDIELKRVGREWRACCPFHKERTPSFFVNDDKAFFNCFGCGAHGDAIEWLVKYRKLDFKVAVEALAGEKPPSEAQKFENNLRSRSNEHVARSVFEYTLDDTERSQQAMARAIWDHSKKIGGTIAEHYLRVRGIKLRRMPECLRFTDNAWIFSYENGWKRSGYPAMIAGVQDSIGRLTAIQTTYLLPDGSWKAPMKKAKLVTGPMVDGAIRLGAASNVLCIAEGIETAMAGQQMFSLPVWAATGQARRKSILLPDVVQTVVLLTDNGGSDATTNQAIQSYRAQGREVIVEAPPDEFKDYADQLVGKKIQTQIVAA